MTRRACVIGHPVAHSRSPLIHRHWLAEYKIDGDYLPEDVAPEKFERFIASLAERGYAGANVTVPNKEAAFRALAHAEPVAAALRAANTIWVEQGRLAGTNTDVYGFLAHIDETVPGWDVEAEQAVVLGAGGSARAIVYALLQRDFSRVIVVNRTLERAQTICTEFGERTIAVSFGELPGWLQDADILVNTTTLGMTGQPPLEIDLAPMQKGAIVYDIVYVPLQTPLLATARARGLRAVDGLGMLLHQAVPGFEKWFGVRPAVTLELRDLLLADLRAKESAR
jgi:shikimate dehydrogenase